MAYLAVTAGKGTVERVVVAEVEQMWQGDSDERSVVSGRVAMEVLESGTSTAGNPQARHCGAFERVSEVAVGVHGSQACCQVYQQGALSRENIADHGEQPPGSETGAGETDTVRRVQHATESATV